MNNERLQTIKRVADKRREKAEMVLEGDSDYDGADGARYVLIMCDLVYELVECVEKGGAHEA